MTGKYSRTHSGQRSGPLAAKTAGTPCDRERVRAALIQPVDHPSAPGLCCPGLFRAGWHFNEYGKHVMDLGFPRTCSQRDPEWTHARHPAIWVTSRLSRAGARGYAAIRGRLRAALRLGKERPPTVPVRGPGRTPVARATSVADAWQLTGLRGTAANRSKPDLMLSVPHAGSQRRGSTGGSTVHRCRRVRVHDMRSPVVNFPNWELPLRAQIEPVGRPSTDRIRGVLRARCS